MTNDGEKILSLSREMRKVFESTSLLLKTATDLMKPEGWDAYNNTAIAASSAAIYNPQYWMPRDVFVFFKSSMYPIRLAFVSVIFEDLDDPTGFKEPLVTAGWVEFREPDHLSSGWQWQTARIALHVDIETAGAAFTDVPIDVLTGRFAPAGRQARVIQVPLVSIDNADDLRGRLIQPLIKDLQTR